MLKSHIQVLLNLRFSGKECLRAVFGVLMMGLPFLWWWKPFLFREMVPVFVTSGIVLLLLACKPSRGNVFLGLESLLLLLLLLYLLVHSLFVPFADRGGLLLNLLVIGVFYGGCRFFRFSVRWVCSVLSGAGILQLVVVVLQSLDLFRMTGPLRQACVAAAFRDYA